MQQLFPDVPVGAVVQVRQNKCDEIVIFPGAVPHDVENEEQTLDSFLPDDVLWVGKFLHDQGDVHHQLLIWESERILNTYLILH